MFHMFKGEWTDKNSIGYLNSYIDEHFLGFTYCGEQYFNLSFSHNLKNYESENYFKLKLKQYIRTLKRFSRALEKVIDFSKSESSEYFNVQISEGAGCVNLTFINSDMSHLRKLIINQYGDVIIKAHNTPRFHNLLGKMIDYIHLLITESYKFIGDRDNYQGVVDNQILESKVNKGSKSLLAPKLPSLTRLRSDAGSNAMNESFIIKHMTLHSEIRSLEELNRTQLKYTRLIEKLKLYKSKLDNKETFEEIAFIGDFTLKVQEASFVAFRINDVSVSLSLGDCYRRVELGLSNYMQRDIIGEVIDALLLRLKGHLNDVNELAQELTLPDTYEEPQSVQ